MNEPMNNVAAIQMCPTPELESNLSQVEKLVAQAVNNSAKLIVLPENFAYPGTKAIKQAMATERTPEGPARAFLADIAKQHGIWLIGGTIPVADGPVADCADAEEKGYAACLAFDPQGEEAARYNKIHLFDANVADAVGSYRESERFLAGAQPVVVGTDIGVVGLSVCYDLRFPELYRRLVAAGAEILVVPAAFTATTGEAHWEMLLRARAVENLCYVIGANQGDRDGRKPTWGGSTIISPWGKVLAEMADGPGVVTAPIDLEKLESARSSLPALEHRRIDVVQQPT